MVKILFSRRLWRLPLPPPAAAALRPAGLRLRLTPLSDHSIVIKKGRPRQRTALDIVSSAFRCGRPRSVVAVGPFHALMALLGFDGKGRDGPGLEPPERDRLAGLLAEPV